jgi:hypothetical protein
METDMIEGFCYLATPYTNYPLGMDTAFEDACVLLAKLVDAGWDVYSPIVHSHPLTGYSSHLVSDHAFWAKYDLPMMERADFMLIGGLLGWNRSAGIRREMNWFKSVSKPVFFVEPIRLAITRFSEVDIIDAA